MEGTPEPSRDPDSLSLFERLPQELVSKLIAYAPNSVFHLKLTSRMLRCRVDNFALELFTIPLVKDIAFSVSWAPITLEIAMDVPEDRSNLFELRFKRRNPPVGGISFRKIFSSNAKTIIYSNYLLQTVRDHKVDHIEVSVGTISIDDPVSLLLDLSSCVRNMQLAQYRVDDVPNNGLLDLPNIDWADVVIEMFSRKLSKMAISNYFHPKYLNTNGVRKLREHLPYLEKEIWFSAGCTSTVDQLTCITNDHFVRVQSSGGWSGSLNVKHISRGHEHAD